MHGSVMGMVVDAATGLALERLKRFVRLGIVNRGNLPVTGATERYENEEGALEVTRWSPGVITASIPED